MKRQLQIILSASTVSILAGSALAQYPISPQLDQPDYPRDRPAPAHQRADRLNGAAKAASGKSRSGAPTPGAWTTSWK